MSYEEGEYEHMMSERAYQEAEMNEYQKHAEFVHFETLRLENEIAILEHQIEKCRQEIKNLSK